jgi:hypothetical protein
VTPNDSGVGDAGAPSATTFTYFSGVYFVPERTDVSTYPVDEATWIVSGDQARLEYNLPRMLVGGHERVSFTGTIVPGAPAIELASADGTASCALNPSDAVLLVCNERFTALTVDLAGVRDEATRDDPSRVAERVQVAEAFSGDPIGVLEANTMLSEPVAGTACIDETECAPDFRCDVETPGEVGFCERISGSGPLGSACVRDEDCVAPLECEIHAPAAEGTCAERGGAG